MSEDEPTKPLSVKVTASEAAMIREGAARLDLSQGRLIVEAVRAFLAAQ